MVVRFSTLIRESFLCTAGVEEVYTKYYSKIPRETFESIVSVDPTTIKDASGAIVKLGKYSQWLLKMFQQSSFRLEDLERISGYLKKLIKYAPRLKTEGVNVDINSFKTPGDLAKFLHEHSESLAPRPDDVTKDPKELLTSTYFLDKGEAEKVFENSGFEIITPKTLKASEFYGANTEWCTRFSEMFKKHNEEGPLWILISKRNPLEERYQFHFESDQFKDIWDNDVDVSYFFTRNPEVESFFKKLYYSKEIETLEDKKIWPELYQITILIDREGTTTDFDRPREVAQEFYPEPSLKSLASEFTLFPENIEKINNWIEENEPLLWDQLPEEETDTDAHMWAFLRRVDMPPLVWAVLKAYSAAYLDVAPDVIEKAITDYCSEYFGQDFSQWNKTGKVGINTAIFKENWWAYLKNIKNKASLEHIPIEEILIPGFYKKESCGIPLSDMIYSIETALRDDMDISDDDFNQALSKELDSL